MKKKRGGTTGLTMRQKVALELAKAVLANPNANVMAMSARLIANASLAMADALLEES
jgi:hypothetical protein